MENSDADMMMTEANAVAQIRWKTSTWKPRNPRTSLFCFVEKIKIIKIFSRFFAYCNRFLPFSPLSARLVSKDFEFKTAKRARNFKFTHQSISSLKDMTKSQGQTRHNQRSPSKEKSPNVWRHYIDFGRLVNVLENNLKFMQVQQRKIIFKKSICTKVSRV